MMSIVWVLLLYVYLFLNFNQKQTPIFIYDGALSFCQFSQIQTNCRNMSKSFHVDINKHKLQVTYQPSHILFDLLDKNNCKIKSAIFYDSTLPDMVKEECQYVSDLYEFLQAKKPEEIKIEEQLIKFNVVRIKKERWFSLKLQNFISPINSQPSSNPHPSSLYQENIKLKQEIQQLKQKTKSLQQQLQRKDKFDYNRIKQYQQNNNSIIQYQNQNLKKLKSKIQNPSKLKNQTQQINKQFNNNNNNYNNNLHNNNSHINDIIIDIYSVNSKCKGYNKYHIQNNIITKIDQLSAVLVFNQQINQKKQKQEFKIQLLRDFDQKWIVMGIMSQQHIDRPYCYCFKNTVCFSGSLGLIFNQLDAIDVGVTPKKGDIISLVCYQKGKIEWILNNTIICQLKLSPQMHKQPLYPYLMLSNTNDSVLINYEPK